MAPVEGRAVAVGHPHEALAAQHRLDGAGPRLGTLPVNGVVGGHGQPLEHRLLEPARDITRQVGALFQRIISDVISASAVQHWEVDLAVHCWTQGRLGTNHMSLMLGDHTSASSWEALLILMLLLDGPSNI